MTIDPQYRHCLPSSFCYKGFNQDLPSAMPLDELSALPDDDLSIPKLPPAVEVEKLLAKIELSDDFSYQMMNLEVWALVETLDRMFPGAWGQFMS
ncbi:MAG: hypothetical protein ACRC62_30725, partial [Microcoleus sp.]